MTGQNLDHGLKLKSELTSDSRKKIPSPVVYYYYDWYLFSRIRRYLTGYTKNIWLILQEFLSGFQSEKQMTEC